MVEHSYFSFRVRVHSRRVHALRDREREREEFFRQTSERVNHRKTDEITAHSRFSHFTAEIFFTALGGFSRFDGAFFPPAYSSALFPRRDAMDSFFPNSL